MHETQAPEAGLKRLRGHTPDTGFGAALHEAVTRMQDVSGADIVALYPYDEETDSFYAPIAAGLPEGDVVHALPDLADQLRRFRLDAEQGKIPDDLSPTSYGPHAWLLRMRRPLITTDAGRDVESSFVRRHKVRGLVGLPLMVGNRIVGLLYVDYVEKPRARKPVDIASTAFLERVQRAAAEVALSLDAARHAEESNILRAVSELVTSLASLSVSNEDPNAAVRQMEQALHRVLATSQLEAAALYVPDPGGMRLTLLAVQGVPTLMQEAPMLSTTDPDQVCRDETLVSALARHSLHPLASLGPHGQGEGVVLILADRDPLALHRRLPVEQTLLQTSADLLGAMLNSRELVDALGESNRTLGAVTRLSQRLLQPGATQEQALRTAVVALTDPALPELDFEFANIFLLESTPDGRLAVEASAGSTMSSRVPAVTYTPPDGTASSYLVPTWAAPGYRYLDRQDIVGYVAQRRRVVVVAARDAADDDHFISGYPEELLIRKQVPILKGDGSTEGYVRAARLREAADRARLRADDDEEGTYRITDDFTLNAELFEKFGHSSLVRVFVPFGSEAAGEPASGVLEAGFHMSRERRLERVQIEALRACAATIAVAVQTARLYEDVTQRAKQLEIVNEVSRAIATSIDLEQTLRLIARNMARAVDTSVCLIALLEEDGSAWYGAAASDMEEVWRQRRVERPEPSIVFDVADKGRPLVVEDALNHELVSTYTARKLDLRSLMALPLTTGEGPIGAVVLGQRDKQRLFTPDEVERASGLAGQAAMAIRNARLHAREEEEHHIQKDVVLVGFGQWGQKAYKHLVLLKNFFNFRTHVVELAWPGRREALAEVERAVLANGDLFYWDDPGSSAPAHEALERELESSCYVITYICTPAETHLPMLKAYYDLSNVVLIEKPLGAPPEEYRTFLDTTDGSVQIVAADHYWFKLEVRLLELLLTEERNLRAFLDEIEEIEIEILEEQSPAGGSGAQIGMIADLIPHAFAVLSLLTPLDRLKPAPNHSLQIGRYHPLASEHETYARLVGYFDHRGRHVRVTIDVGKGVTNAKWIKLIGPRRMGGRRSFYKFDFSRGEAIDGTQSALRAATRPIRQPGVPDNAHLSMLRHVIDKKNPAVGILSIREAIRANARIQELERLAHEMVESGQWVPYEHGQRPIFNGEITHIDGQRVLEAQLSAP
jgi:GAF domain-containing protein